jgi:hypothetical protein
MNMSAFVEVTLLRKYNVMYFLKEIIQKWIGTNECCFEIQYDVSIIASYCPSWEASNNHELLRKNGATNFPF